MEGSTSLKLDSKFPLQQAIYAQPVWHK